MKDINLLPKEYKKKGLPIDIGSMAFIAAFVGAVALVVVAFAGMSIWNLSINSRIDSCDKDIQRYSLADKYVTENKNLQTQIDVRRKFLDYIHPKVTISDIMGYITYCVPKDANVKISNYSDDGTIVTLTCNSNSLSGLSNFVTNLKAIGVFPSVKLQTFTSDAKTGITMAIQCSRQAVTAATGTTPAAATSTPASK